MGANDKNKRAAEAAALLQQNLVDAQAEFDALSETATEEEKAIAQAKIDAATKAISTKGKPSKKLVEVKFLLSPTGKFNLAYNEGEVAEFEEKQAAELVEANYAEFVK